MGSPGLDHWGPWRQKGGGLSEGRPSQLLSVGALGAGLCADTENPVEGESVFQGSELPCCGSWRPVLGGGCTGLLCLGSGPRLWGVGSP